MNRTIKYKEKYLLSDILMIPIAEMYEALIIECLDEIISVLLTNFDSNNIIYLNNI